LVTRKNQWRESNTSLKIAIVHDFLINWGEAEYLVNALHQALPDAPVYCALYSADNTFSGLKKASIKTSLLQNIPGIRKFYKLFSWLYPFYFYFLSFRKYDILIVTDRLNVKFVRKQGRRMICLSDLSENRYFSRKGKVKKGDGGFSQRFKKFKQYIFFPKKIDLFLAGSELVASRLWQIYGVSSEILRPPAVENTVNTANNKRKDFYLIISRLEQDRNIEQAIRAFNCNRKRLIIIGDGKKLKYFRSIAGPTVLLMGAQSDFIVNRYLAQCRALIAPCEQNIAITAIRAQVIGKPVISYNKGALLEIITEYESGLFYKGNTIGSLMKVINEFEQQHWDNWKIMRDSGMYSMKSYKDKLMAIIMRDGDINLLRYSLASATQYSNEEGWRNLVVTGR